MTIRVVRKYSHYRFLHSYLFIKSHQPAQSSIRFLYFDGLLRQSQLLIAFQHIRPMEVSVENKMPVPNAMSSSPEAIEMLHYTLSLSRASFSDWHCYLAKPSQLLIAFQHISPMEVSAENKMPVPNAMSSNPEAIEMLHYTLSLSKTSFSDWHCFRPKPVTYFLNNFTKFII